MSTITFWQVLVTLLFASNFLKHVIRDGKDIDKTTSVMPFFLVATLINYSLFAQGFYSVFAWPQYTVVGLFTLLTLATLHVVFVHVPNRKVNKYNVGHCSIFNFLFFSVLYYGGSSQPSLLTDIRK